MYLRKKNRTNVQTRKIVTFRKITHEITHEEKMIFGNKRFKIVRIYTKVKKLLTHQMLFC